jgi:subfamily B ATP-binding cassette protein MsbA
MRNLWNIWGFGWPYLRHYWNRLLLGVLLGVVFGLSGAMILGASKTLFDRLTPASQRSPEKNGIVAPGVSAGTESGGEESLMKRLRRSADDAKRQFEQRIDPWLPTADRALDSRQVVGVLLLLPLLFAFRGFIGYLSSYCLGWVSERVINDLRVDVLIKLNSLSLDFFNRSTTGDLLTRVNGDTVALQRTLNLGFSDLIKEPVTVLSVFAGLCYVDWRLTLFVMVFLPFCLVPIVILGKKARRASKGNVSATVLQSSLLVEALSSIRVVKAFNLESAQVQRFRKLAHELVHHGMKGIQAKELTNPIIETISALGLGVLIVFIFQSRRGLSDMVLFLGGVAAIYTPLKKLASLHVLFQQTSVGVGRLRDILREEPSVREPVNPLPVSRFDTALTFEDVTFAYGERRVLENVTLAIPRGLKLGLAGESGSGKSTLVNLAFRFYDPVGGAVRIDGRDIRELSTRDLRQLMALVSQEVVVFDQTVAENIACGRPGATRAEIEAAARAAHAHEFILQLPDRYETRLGERGVTLSGGQRQRIAIARAFIRNAPILVLDEATASLDAQSEAEVQSAIDELAENRTVICVAHRLSTLAKMDRIIVLSQGRIVEEGGFNELIRAGGIFASMARRQGILIG